MCDEDNNLIVENLICFHICCFDTLLNVFFPCLDRLIPSYTALYSWNPFFTYSYTEVFIVRECFLDAFRK